MKKLSEPGKDSVAVIKSLGGDQRFMSRITSIGLTPGSTVTVIGLLIWEPGDGSVVPSATPGMQGSGEPGSERKMI